MEDMTRQGYAASFTSERSLRHEVEVVLRLSANGMSWIDVRKEVLARNLFQVRRTSTAQTYLTLVRRRIVWLDERLRSLYLEGARSDTLAILLYTFLASYRFPREFVLEELRYGLRMGRSIITEEQIAAFFDRKREQHADVAHWTTTSQKKVAQVMVRILRECGLLEPTSQEWRIQPLTISHELDNYVRREPRHRYFLPLILIE